MSFCNVLGFSGYGIPVFSKQFELGGSVTVTHTDLLVFMTTLKAV
ncbi:polysaccharide biosynthesis protein [uncultured Paraglaciecola sp.]